ncbi:MAG: cobalt-precorrin-5B (C(1))-methyltransferase [Chloroflexi bacterium]|nr:cobalt-precorrin-5B (C(1))-methyltransferase [Chloroflexota bacterium]
MEAGQAPPLREGFTTGACAAAAAAAATRALLTGQAVDQAVIDLPVRRRVSFAVCRCEFEAEHVTCGVIKDAGDDPDVTHGAEIQASVQWVQEGEGDPAADVMRVEIAGGPGVGIVTRPGLPVAVGEAAINPVPRRIITQAVMAQLDAAQSGSLPGCKLPLCCNVLRVTIRVPNGEELAQRTLNPRLGILGGISILGSTGIVKPFSQSAYRASICVELKAAARNGLRRAVLTTGARSEDYALDQFSNEPHDPNLPLRMGYVQVGDHIGYALAQCARLGFAQVVIAGMIGKLSKLAQGRAQTHVDEGSVDFEFLAALAAQLGAPPDLVEHVRHANTAHHAQVLLSKAGLGGLEQRVAQLAAERAFALGHGAFEVSVLLFSMSGSLLGRASAGNPLD